MLTSLSKRATSGFLTPSVLYHVTVEFNKDFVIVDGDKITIGIKSRPVHGAANREIMKKIARHIGAPSSAISIRSGHRESKKIIQVH